MTVQELYDWAIERGCEEYTLCKNNNLEVFEVKEAYSLEASQFYPEIASIVILD